MRVKLTAKHPRPASPGRAPVRAGSPSARKSSRASDAGHPAAIEKPAAPRAGGSAAEGAPTPTVEAVAATTRKRDDTAAKTRVGAAENAPRARTQERRTEDPSRRTFRPAEPRGPRAPRESERGAPVAGRKSAIAERGAQEKPPRAPSAADKREARGPRVENERGERGTVRVRDTDRPSGGAGERSRSNTPERSRSNPAERSRGNVGERGPGNAAERSRGHAAERSRTGTGERPARAERPARGAVSDVAGQRKTGHRVKQGATSPNVPAPRRETVGARRTGPSGNESSQRYERSAPSATRGRSSTGHRADAPKFEGKHKAPSPRATKPVKAAPAASHAEYADHADGTMRLSKRMSELGLCSRREADEWIENGWVRVDGERIDTLGSRVRPDQQIEITRDAHVAQSRQVTILLHKPVGYVSGQAEDGYEPAITLITAENRWEGDRATTRFLPAQLRALAPAGRLDIDSTGLLVLTQDGRIAKQLIGEHSSVEKEYLVRVAYGERTTDIDRNFPAEQLALLRFGLSLDDSPLKPAKVSWQNGEQLRFVLREGKKRQIRRMCELVGLQVVGLKRVRMGRVALGPLPQGKWRYLLPDEAF